MEMEERTRAFRRHERSRVIENKRHLINEIYGRECGYELYPVDGKLSKGKIHCSCPLCRKKTKMDGWKHRDKKRLIQPEEDFEGVEIIEVEKEFISPLL